MVDTITRKPNTNTMPVHGFGRNPRKGIVEDQDTLASAELLLHPDPLVREVAEHVEKFEKSIRPEYEGDAADFQAYKKWLREKYRAAHIKEPNE